jgi:SAM-dependent methyltransferase
MSWKDIWRRKGQLAANPSGLSELIATDGFDTPWGKITTSEWVRMVTRAARRVSLRPDERICEVGCGAGAFLYPLYQSGYRGICGLDYSPAHIAHCRRVMALGLFVAAEAAGNPFRDGVFDVVFCNGVFLYFPTLEYGDRTVREIVRTLKSNGRTLILDVTDAGTSEEYEARRRASLAPGEYDRLYADAPQLFYERDWWHRNADRWGLSVEIYDQDVEGYGTSAFRYNVLLRKEESR